MNIICIMHITGDRLVAVFVGKSKAGHQAAVRSAELVLDTTSPVLGKPSSQKKYTSKTTAECVTVSCRDGLSGDKVRQYVGIGGDPGSVDMREYSLVEEGAQSVRASKPVSPGHAYYCRHLCFDSAGNVAFSTSAPVIVDTTPPNARTAVWQYQATSSQKQGNTSVKDSLCAKWLSFKETESFIVKQELQLMAESPGSGKVLKTYPIGVDEREKCIDPAGLVGHGGQYHFRIRATNAAGLAKDAESPKAGTLDGADPSVTALTFLNPNTNRKADNQKRVYLREGATLKLKLLVQGVKATSGVKWYEFATVRADAVEADRPSVLRDLEFTKRQRIPMLTLERGELEKIVNEQSPRVYIAVRARSKIGRVSAIQLSGEVFLDLVLPSISGLRISTDGAMTKDLSLVKPSVIYPSAEKSVRVSVTASAERGSFTFDKIHDDGATASGILSAEFCLGRATNNCLVQEWKTIDISNPGKVSFEIEKTLQSGSLYYVNLRATDRAGKMSYVSSPPTLVDLNAPTVEQWRITRNDGKDGCNDAKSVRHGQVTWQTQQDRVCACVRGVRDASEVRMELHLQDSAGTKFVLTPMENDDARAGSQEHVQNFTGTEFISKQIAANDVRVHCFEPSTLLQPDSYGVELKARDIVGHSSIWPYDGEIVVDTTPPTTGSVREHLGDAHETDCMVSDGKSMSIHVDWDGFEGNFSAQNMIDQRHLSAFTNAFSHANTPFAHTYA